MVDFYLTHAEQEMVNTVKQNFARVIVVMNVGGMVDTSWFHDDAQIQSVLMAWQGGMEGGLATAELLAGEGNPSGKLSDTFARELNDYPSTYNFHESEKYVEYTDDIYVGYRYFETIPGAKEKVNYPFGFGLSYTQFVLGESQISIEEDQIRCMVSVTNTGDMAGKEVVQAYYGAPQGKLGKAARVLCAFAKTRLLQPGETQLMTLCWKIADMASYDDCGKVCKSAYVLEQGEYKFYIGTSVRDAVENATAYTVVKDTVTQQLTSRLAPTSLTKRMLADGTYEELETTEPVDTDANELEKMTTEEMEAFAAKNRRACKMALMGRQDTG